MQGGGAAVDVIVAATSAGELEFAKAEGLLRKKGQELLACIGHGIHDSGRYRRFQGFKVSKFQGKWV
jgi:hypothetical protein